MPQKTLSVGGTSRTLDARPDRIDFRDREYRPALVSLPPEYPAQAVIDEYLPVYAKKLILDQGSEGACTGFGLAATINYLLFARYVHAHGLEAIKKLPCVSPRMLYQLAQVYDEWPGEDYEGSSCRGAMKGWHRHGVCAEQLWPYRDARGRERFVRPKPKWQDDAAKRPVGAYYRVNKDSITDMQAAINEVGAIYVSAIVHDGWMRPPAKKLPTIPMRVKETGGHAFAIMGYTVDGFIVQNSWGPTWGYNGFALLTYEDWVQHGTDAWVAVLGAPVKVANASRSFSSLRLDELESGRASWFWRSDSAGQAERYDNPKVEPLSEGEAYEHTVVLGNDGRPLNRYLDVPDAQSAVREAAFVNPLKWLKSTGATKLAIYAHGGLNDESASLARIRVMAPYFRENGIYPLFVTWKTGLGETISGMLGDVVTRFLSRGRDVPHEGWFDSLRSQISDARDRAIEVACEQVLIKPVWSQMKQNAEAAAGSKRGLRLLAADLASLRQNVPNLEIHLVGHSAGSILHGHLLDRLAGEQLQVKTCTLYAPACTVEFAMRHYGRAHDKGVLPKRQLYCHLMNDERERADSVGPYGKSLLYLVSRALEERHKTPLLGMEGAWSDVGSQDMWNDETLGSVGKWQAFVKSVRRHTLFTHDEKTVSDGVAEIQLAHGSFDNDVDVVASTLKRIRGSRRKLTADVERLRDF